MQMAPFLVTRLSLDFLSSKTFPCSFFLPGRANRVCPMLKGHAQGRGVQNGAGAAPLGSKIKPWCKLPGRYLFTTSSSRLACPPPQASLTQENFREAILSHVNRLHVLNH